MFFKILTLFISFILVVVLDIVIFPSTLSHYLYLSPEFFKFHNATATVTVTTTAIIAITSIVLVKVLGKNVSPFLQIHSNVLLFYASDTL